MGTLQQNDSTSNTRQNGNTTRHKFNAMDTSNALNVRCEAHRHDAKAITEQCNYCETSFSGTRLMRVNKSYSVVGSGLGLSPPWWPLEVQVRQTRPYLAHDQLLCFLHRERNLKLDKYYTAMRGLSND